MRLIWEKIGKVRTKKIKERKDKAAPKPDKEVLVQINSNLEYVVI